MSIDAAIPPAGAPPWEESALSTPVGRRPLWLSFHIFYGSNPFELLTRCVRPLVRRLKEADQIVRWFYINYWLEGNHIRLRLAVHSDKDRVAVEEQVVRTVQEYLRLNPSFHPSAELESADYYDRLFAAEFSDADRDKYFDADGHPIIQPDSSISVRSYEPEWDRYGGPVGIEIAEEHFELSAEIAAELIAKGNMGVRSVQLGVGAELMAVLVGTLFPDRDEAMAFLENYHQRWASMFEDSRDYVERHNTGRFSENHRTILKQVVPVYEAARRGGDGLTGVLRDWREAVSRTRQRLEAAAAEAPFQFAWQGGGETTSDIDRLCWRVGFSYQHMMDNRLMLSVSDEAYLSFELLKALAAAGERGLDGNDGQVAA